MSISGDDLRLARNYLDLTQAELAERLDVSPRTIVNWELKGVPSKRVPMVHRVLGPVISEAREATRPFDEEPTAWVPNDEQMRELDAAADAQWQAYAAPHGVRRGMSPTERRARLLKPFSVNDLLDELRDRALSQGGRSSVWDAERYEAYQAYVAPQWSEQLSTSDSDPDYSNMSEEDAMNYGLAAHKGDAHIGPEDDPHEP